MHLVNFKIPPFSGKRACETPKGEAISHHIIPPFEKGGPGGISFHTPNTSFNSSISPSIPGCCSFLGLYRSKKIPLNPPFSKGEANCLHTIPPL